MFAVSEVAPYGSTSSQTVSQQQTIASVIALQRVIAAQSGAESGDASARNFSGNADRDRAVRSAERSRQRAEAAPTAAKSDVPSLPDRSAQARSIVEAQEASMNDRKIVAAFHARHGLTDLLSVIRDPEDRMLPSAPEE